MNDTDHSLLARVPLFAGLNPHELGRVAELAETVEVAAGTELTHEGRYEGFFYVVIAGTVEIDRGGAAIDTVGPGGFLGEIALIDDGPRTATAVTLTPCQLLRLDNRRFDMLTEAVPAIGDAVRAAMDERLERLDAAG